MSFRSARDVLERDELLKSRLVKVHGSSLLFVASPQVLKNKHALRHTSIVTRVGKENAYVEGELRAKFWTNSFFEPSDWFSKFKAMDETIEHLKKNQQATEAISA